MQYDFVDLRLFLATVETGSITGGADRSSLALPSASGRIKRMEQALGIPLLVRKRRGVEPSPAGHALAHHAQIVLQQLERMRGELDDYAHGLRGHVRLMANTAATSEFLPELLAQWLVQHPNVDVELEERPSHAIVEAVVSGLADAGIVADWAEATGLEVLPFRLDQLVLVVPRDHALADLSNVAFEDVVDQDYVGLTEGAALQEHLARHATGARRRLRVRVRVQSFDAICRLVEKGVGIGVVPRTAAHRCCRTMAISAVPLSDAWAKRHLGICVRAMTELSAHARRLVEHLARAGQSEEVA